MTLHRDNTKIILFTRQSCITYYTISEIMDLTSIFSSRFTHRLERFIICLTVENPSSSTEEFITRLQFTILSLLSKGYVLCVDENKRLSDEFEWLHPLSPLFSRICVFDRAVYFAFFTERSLWHTCKVHYLFNLDMSSTKIQLISAMWRRSKTKTIRENWKDSPRTHSTLLHHLSSTVMT